MGGRQRTPRRRKGYRRLYRSFMDRRRRRIRSSRAGARRSADKRVAERRRVWYRRSVIPVPLPRAWWEDLDDDELLLSIQIVQAATACAAGLTGLVFWRQVAALVSLFVEGTRLNLSFLVRAVPWYLCAACLLWCSGMLGGPSVRSTPVAKRAALGAGGMAAVSVIAH